MSALRVNMEFGWYLGVLECEEIDDRVFYVDGIILCLHEEGRRSLSSWVNIRVWGKVLFGEREVARVNNDGKVGAATEFVRSVDRIVEPLVKVSAERSGKMRPGGEAEGPDAIGIDVPLSGVGANDSKGALSILQRSR